MLLSAEVNGLGNLSLKPWHLKANYQTFDPDGNPKDSGIFEEWWDGPQKYKLSYTSKNFNQVEYRNGPRGLVTGDTDSPPPQTQMVGLLLVSPMPSPSEIGTQTYDDKDSTIGNVNLKCLWVRAPKAYTAASTFCLSTQDPALRVEAQGSLLIYFNNLLKVSGQYVAKQITVQNGPRQYLHIEITVLEHLASLQDTLFVAPAGAVSAQPQPRVSAGLIAPARLSGDAPRYPLIAESARVQGIVVLQAIIDKQGDVSDLRIVSGPPMLQQAAYNAVKTWKYKPFLLNGKPVLVRTQMNVVFTLSGIRR